MGLSTPHKTRLAIDVARGEHSLVGSPGCRAQTTAGASLEVQIWKVDTATVGVLLYTDGN